MSYRIHVENNKLIVIITRPGKADLYQEVDMSGSGDDEGGQYMYFKSGVYA
ncbi:hypothetical protein [Agarivorans sp. DSG3-1]|uniref:hypothetical protein n=1 Tax=Agarivorans sp. DSG3-1 TaxID=3342249 RepID=UPI00398EC09E